MKQFALVILLVVGHFEGCAQAIFAGGNSDVTISCHTKADNTALHLFFGGTKAGTEFTCAGSTTEIPLPIELLSFTARWNEDAYQTVVLEWQTTVEVNNDYFVVEKSADGVRFFSVLKVKGAGNSNQLISYSDYDNAPYLEERISYYRLKQIDFDGSFSYSNIIPLQRTTNSDAITLFPNPATGNITYQIDSPTEKEMIVTIYNTLGEIVLTSTNSINKGLSKTTIDISSLSFGNYYMQLLSGDSSVYKPFVISKL